MVLRNAETELAALVYARIQLPTLMGDVTLNTRSMLRSRSGRPRSDMSKSGLTAFATDAIWMLRWASSSLPETRATRLNTDDAPPSPPVKKYHGISRCQTGSLITG